MTPDPQTPGSRYFDAWRRRTRKLLAPSGRLRETALILAQSQGQTSDHWEKWLRNVLAGQLSPNIDELMAVDAILARPQPSPATPPLDEELFPDLITRR